MPQDLSVSTESVLADFANDLRVSWTCMHVDDHAGGVASARTVPCLGAVHKGLN